MKWIILKDHTEEDQAHSAVGTGRFGRASEQFRDAWAGAPREARQALAEGFCADWPHEFRLLDDDRNVNLEGRCMGLDDADGDHAFAPLDWAEGYCGATIMEYRRVGETEWEIL